jgi:iron complex transport system permease protein
VSGRRRHGAVLAALGALALATAAASLAMGAVSVSPGDVLAVVARHLGFAGADPPARADAVLWGIRLPRVLLGMTVGAALGVAGTALQGVFRNPLADPHLLGVGPGASLGAVVLMLAVGATPQAAMAGATVGAIAASAAVRRAGDLPDPGPTRLVLFGVALGAVLSAWVGFVVFAADRSAVPSVEFWLLGSLTGATWRTLGNTFILAAAGLLVVGASARSLDLMALGESEAGHLGVDVELVTRIVLLGAALEVGAAVGAAGVVGFVGLLVPHVMRRLVGPGHRTLLVAAALGGAILVTGSDLAARTLAAPIEIPVGLVTTVVGGPFFLWLLLRSARRVAP